MKSVLLRLVMALCVCVFLAPGGVAAAQTNGRQQLTGTPSVRLARAVSPWPTASCERPLRDFAQDKKRPRAFGWWATRYTSRSSTRCRTNRLGARSPILGATFTGRSMEDFVEALVPFDKLASLESDPSVLYVRPPLRVNEPVAMDGRGTAVAPVAAAATSGQSSQKRTPLHGTPRDSPARGSRSASWTCLTWSPGTRRLPQEKLVAPTGTFCRSFGAACDIWATNSTHGEGVGEIVHEMAPQAELYLASATTATDLQAAVDYFTGQGVDIITRSLTAEYDGPGNGTDRSRTSSTTRLRTGSRGSTRRETMPAAARGRGLTGEAAGRIQTTTLGLILLPTTSYWTSHAGS